MSSYVIPQISEVNMQRWFFLEDPGNAALRAGKGESISSGGSMGSTKYTLRKWFFRVTVPNLRKEDVVCVIGDMCELGGWQPEKCIPLEREEDSDIWSGEISIPDKKRAFFRYCVCLIVDLGLQVIVRSWEANLMPRVIPPNGDPPTIEDEPHIYGSYENRYRVDRGWLNKESVIQLKLCKNPLTLFRPRYQHRSVNIKITPVHLIRHNPAFPKTMAEALDESLSADTQDTVDNPKHAFTEVASLLSEDPTFHIQGQFGHELLKDDMLIFQSTVLFPANIAFLIDLYIYGTRVIEGEPPYHAGFSYLLPTALQSSEGHVVLPVTSTKHRPLGQIRIEYIQIGPMLNFRCDMSVSYARHWKKSRSGLDVGHRGSGSSFKTKVQNCAEVRENTIASLKNAIEHGADFVEFDVQLSKDMVPIIYHDFHVCIAMKKKKDLMDSDMLEIPLKELTLEQLRLLQIYHLSEGKTKNPKFYDEDLDDHQPFPTLQQALETLDSHTGFNIEIKWTMLLDNGTYELYHPTDLNVYLDTILEVVLRYGGERRIVFSCFNPDICQVIRLKQNKYPVMFLTVGESQIYDKYSDPRCWSIKSATQYAMMIEILGVNVHTEDLLRDPNLVQFATLTDLVMFCWGDENADPATIKFLKGLGLHGVIYDKIHEYSGKEIKESIFLVEARDSQKDLLKKMAAKSAVETPTSPPPQPVLKERLLDYEKAKEQIGDAMSTATSLQSLESHMSDYEKPDCTS